MKNALSKYGILSVELQKAMEKDQAISNGIDGGLNYADNEDDESDDNLFDNMKPAEEVMEEHAEEVPASAPEKEDKNTVTDHQKLIKSLQVIEKHRPEDFNAACEEFGIPAPMWKEAKGSDMKKMLEKLNG